MTDNKTPARRMRHGERPEQPLYFGPEAGQPRRWAALITSAGHGVLQEYGTAFEHAQPGQEVLEVMEILPGATNKAAEEGELPMLDTVEFVDLLTGYEMASGDIQARVLNRKAIIEYFNSKLSAARRVANKAEVEKDAARYQFLRHADLDEMARVYWTEGEVPSGAEFDATIDHAMGVATPPATTGASTAPVNDLTMRMAKCLKQNPPSLPDHACRKCVGEGELVKEGFLCTYHEALAYIDNPAPASTVLTDERQAFEVMVRTWDVPADALERWPDGRYVQEQIEQCWSGWESRSKVAAKAGQVAVPEGFVLMPKRLTAENGAKSLFLGEFKESTRVQCHECDGSGEDSEYDSACVECGGTGSIEQAVSVEWDTIKRIYDMAVEHLAAAPSAPAVAQQAPAADLLDAARYRKIKADNCRAQDKTFCLFWDEDGNLLPVSSKEMDDEIDRAAQLKIAAEAPKGGA